MTYVAYTFLGLWAFYLWFAVSVNVYRQWVRGRLNVLNKVMFAPVLILFGLLDVLLNWTVFMLIGPPPKGCYTISDRLEYYHRSKSCYPFQKDLAQFVCEKLLTPVDPSGEHC